MRCARRRAERSIQGRTARDGAFARRLRVAWISRIGRYADASPATRKLTSPHHRVLVGTRGQSLSVRHASPRRDGKDARPLRARRGRRQRLSRGWSGWPRHHVAPTLYVESSSATGELVALFEDWQLDPMPLYIAYPPNRLVSAKLRVFIDWVAELVGEAASVRIMSLQLCRSPCVCGRFGCHSQFRLSLP